MAVNGSEFEWTAKKVKAAQLLAEDKFSDKEIADKLEIGERTLNNWKKVEAFTTRISQIVEATRQAILTEGIADKVNRVAALNDRWERMRGVITERATSMADDCPGSESGLMVHTVKAVGNGPSAYTVDEYAVDTGLLREMRAHEEQAAKELGQWTEKKEINGKIEVVDAKQSLISILNSVASRAGTDSGDSATDAEGS